MLLLFAVLGCSELLPATAHVEQVTAACGSAEFVVVRDGGYGDVVPVSVDGREVQRLRLAAGESTVVTLPLEGRHLLAVAKGAPESVLVPPSDVLLRGVPALQAPLQGDEVTVGMQVLGSCRNERMRLVAQVQSSGARSEFAVDPQGVTVMALGQLLEGAHPVSVQVVDGDVVVTQTEVDVRVGPPCRDAWCRDRDGDGYDSLSVGGVDCDDSQPAVFPGATVFPDQDHDGASPLRSADLNCDGVLEYASRFDCNDNDPQIPREEDPLPTGIDEDCDGLVDEGTVAFDDDDDGFSEQAGDCNDADRTVFPGAAELPDCKDNDCDGAVDEGVTRLAIEDVYEPNDDAPYELSGAQPLGGFFGGHSTTDDDLVLTLRGPHDAERFSLYTHDGAGDTYHVTAQVLSAGDGLLYRVRLEGEMGFEEGLLGAGASLRMLGRVGRDDTGMVRVVIEPVGEAPAHCPLRVQLTSG